MATVITDNEQTTRLSERTWNVVPEEPTLTCRCCNPGNTLIPRAGQHGGERYALCLHSGRMHLVQGGEVSLVVRPQTEPGGVVGGQPALAPGVRVDLSRDTYA